MAIFDAQQEALTIENLANDALNAPSGQHQAELKLMHKVEELQNNPANLHAINNQLSWDRYKTNSLPSITLTTGNDGKVDKVIFFSSNFSTTKWSNGCIDVDKKLGLKFPAGHTAAGNHTRLPGPEIMNLQN